MQANVPVGIANTPHPAVRRADEKVAFFCLRAYAEKWAKYHLEGEISTKEIMSVQGGRVSEAGSIKAE